MANKTKLVPKIIASKKNIFPIFLILLLISIFTVSIIYIDNKNIDYEYFNFNSQVDATANIKIVHLSDLHFPKISVDINKLVQRLIDEKPHIIAITGDLIDGGATFETCGVSKFIADIKDLAPIFYVYGNHELRNSDSKNKLTDFLTDMKVNVLTNESVNIEINNLNMTIIGLQDNVNFNSDILKGNVDADKNFKILLAHRPEKWENYTSHDNDILPNLILTGHIHGGQFRVLGRGVYAPNQGFFPKYDGGIYKTEDKNSTMIISRGVGNSIIPIRFNNKPNVPIITLNSLR